jgi:hypothetical protein
MKANLLIVEQLEARQFLSLTPVATGHVPAAASMVQKYELVSGSTLESIMRYAGTATNQSGKTSKIALVLTDIKGMREGVIYVNNSRGGTTPISFTMTSKLTFSFDFTMSGERNKAVGKLSADGKTISGTWISTNSTGIVGGGSFRATHA